MRSLLIVATAILTLNACTSTPTPPAKEATAPAAAAPKAPQCYNGDSGKFENVGAKANIAGVDVECHKTADGKNAQWMGMKKK